MSLLLVIVVAFLVFGGGFGGWYGNSAGYFGGPGQGYGFGFGGGIGILLLVILFLALTGRL